MKERKFNDFTALEKKYGEQCLPHCNLRFGAINYGNTKREKKKT